MEERRKAPRHRVLKAGNIGFNRSAGVDCRVRNLSATGACLEVASQIGIPEYFVLAIEADHLHQACHVVWRNGNRMGVEYCADEQPVPPRAA